MELINANDANLVEQYRRKRTNLIYEKEKEGSFNTKDFYLVRATDYIYPGHFQYPLCNIPFLTKNNVVISNVIGNILDEKEHIDPYKEEEKYDARKEIIKSYLPLSTQYRSTVHFTLNGLVSSHSKGNFDNKNFIIIDKLSKHLGKSDIRSLKDADTFISGNVNLSDECVILVKKDKYEQLLIEFPCLKEYNVILYEGEQKTAVEMFLTNNNIISFNIRQHGFEYLTTFEANTIPNFIRSYLKKVYEIFKIESMSHYVSQEYKEDDQNSLILWEYYEEMFFNYFFNKIDVSQDNKKQLLEQYFYKLSHSERMYNEKIEDTLKNVITEMGLEKFKDIVDEFNSNILQSIKDGEFEVNSVLIEKLKNKKHNK